MKYPVRCRGCGHGNEVASLTKAPGDSRCAKCGVYLFRVSPTQILMLDRCPRSWHRKYVLGEDGPAPSLPMRRGSIFHAEVARLLGDPHAAASYAAHVYVDHLPKPAMVAEEKRQFVFPFGVIDLVIDAIDSTGTIREIKTGRPPDSAARPDHVFQVSIYAASEIWKNRPGEDVHWSIDYVSLHTGQFNAFTGTVTPAHTGEIETTIEEACRTARKFMALDKNEAWGILEGCMRCDWCRHR